MVVGRVGGCIVKRRHGLILGIGCHSNKFSNGVIMAVRASGGGMAGHLGSWLWRRLELWVCRGPVALVVKETSSFECGGDQWL